MSPAAPMRLHIIGASQRTRQTLDMLFQNRGKGAYILSNGADSVAVILDLDGLQAEQEWRAYHHQHPERLAVGLSLKPRPLDGVIEVLQKPVKSRDLMAALQQLHQALGRHPASVPPRRPQPVAEPITDVSPQPAPAPVSPLPFIIPGRQTRTTTGSGIPSSATVKPRAADDKTVNQARCKDSRPHSQAQTLTSFIDITAISQPSPLQSLRDKYKDICGQASDIDTGDTEQIERLLFDTRDHLLAHLQATVNSYAFIQLPQRLRINDRYYITLDNAATVFTNLDDNALQRLARAQLSTDDVKLSTVPEDEDLSDTHSRSIRVALMAFQWKLALWTYRGRLPAGTDISARVYIKHWPNFTRLLECPDAMRMAALWSEQPMTLPHTAQALKIPQRHVFAFYSAMHAIGLAGQARRETDQLFEEPSMSTPPPGRGFFRRMLNHLHASFTQDERRQGTG